MALVTEPATPLLVLLVEDDLRLAAFTREYLETHGVAVVHVADGRRALSEALAGRFDAVLLDLMLPGKDGLEVLRELRTRRCATPVLVLTARDAVEDRVRGLDAGADDYLPKPFAFAELLARVRALLRRGSPQTSVLRVGDLRIDLAARSAERAGRPLELTAKEFALLEYLARHAGEVVTRTMIAQHVWDIDFDTFSNVIDVYIRYLRRKVDDPFETKLIQTRRGVGYVLRANA